MDGSLQESPDAVVVESNNNISLLQLLHRCFGWQFYAVGLLKFVADCTGFVGPMLLNKLVGFIEDKNEPLSYGYLYAAAMFVTTLIGKDHRALLVFVTISPLYFELCVHNIFYSSQELSAALTSRFGCRSSD